jgi:predicted GNAT family N-acyltransferase
MPATTPRRKKQKSEDQILDEATLRLLRGIKKHEKARGKVIASDEMRKRGYSERFIAKMEQA